MILHEQHGGDDDVGCLDVGAAALQALGIVPPFGGGVQAKLTDLGYRALELRTRALDRARKMTVERDDHEADRHCGAVASAAVMGFCIVQRLEGDGCDAALGGEALGVAARLAAHEEGNLGAALSRRPPPT